MGVPFLRFMPSEEDIVVEEMKKKIKISVNGTWHDFEIGRDIKPSDTLSHVLREILGLTGVKVACDQGACGACTVIIDGEAVLSCMTLAVEVDGCHVLTIEGLEKDDPVVEAFATQCEPGFGTAMQCGFCTPGFIMTAKAFLDQEPDPTPAKVKDALSGNLCRCGTYPAVIQAVLHAADKIKRPRG
jgi:aerobic-type carbon monoxide dehydrogenase small subunit (CoxS/CutS family)